GATRPGPEELPKAGLPPEADGSIGTSTPMPPGPDAAPRREEADPEAAGPAAPSAPIARTDEPAPDSRPPAPTPPADPAGPAPAGIEEAPGPPPPEAATLAHQVRKPAPTEDETGPIKREASGPPALRLEALEALALRSGEAATLPIRVRRDGVSGPVD